MAGKVPVVRDDVYDEMAATYQVIEIARLNVILKNHKIPKRVRRKICSQYFFENGVYLDCGWIKVDGVQVWPTLCFAERPLHPTEGLGEVRKLYALSQFFAFHEYLHGAVVSYYDELRENTDGIEHGNL